MSLPIASPDFNSLVVDHARKDFPLLDARASVADALARIRREGVGERVIYFFAVDEEERLVGVLPTRRLLTAPLETPLRGDHGPARCRHSCERDGSWKRVNFSSSTSSSPSRWWTKKNVSLAWSTSVYCRGNPAAGRARTNTLLPPRLSEDDF